SPTADPRDMVPTSSRRSVRCELLPGDPALHPCDVSLFRSALRLVALAVPLLSRARSVRPSPNRLPSRLIACEETAAPVHSLYLCERPNKLHQFSNFEQRRPAGWGARVSNRSTTGDEAPQQGLHKERREPERDAPHAPCQRGQDRQEL